MSKRAIAIAMMAMGMLLPASVARADTANILMPQRFPADAADGWQAGPCTEDTPTECSPATRAQFFKTAGGHPPVAFTQFTIKHEVLQPGNIEPLVEPVEGRIPETIRVDLPPGLSVNPQATPEKCGLVEFFHKEHETFAPQCKPGTRIGESQVDLVNEEAGFLGLSKGDRVGFNFAPELFNLEPSPEEPALFGFVLAGALPVLLRTEVSWQSDFHESFIIAGLPDLKTLHIGGLLAPLAIYSDRLLAFGRAGDGTLATNPTTCFDPEEPLFRHLYSSWIREDSFEEPDLAFPLGTTPVESALPRGVQPEGCASVPFEPSIEVAPGTEEVDSPASPTVTTRLKVEDPGRGGGPIAESHLRKAEVTLPKGLGLNPAGSVGLAACSDAQFHKGERVVENSCPADSVIGTAEIKTPVLPKPLQGNVYIGEPKSTDPTSGEEFRTLVEAKSEELGVVVRLIGNVAADPKTGQLTATFTEQEVSPLFGNLPRGLPQLPFESIALRFDQDNKVFTAPPTCSPSTTSSEMEPWARPHTDVSSTASFTLSSVPGGGKCPQTLAQRAFSPVYTARPDRSQGGAFTPFRVHIGRADGQQEIKSIDVNLPKGLIGKLAGIPYCSDGAIAAAASKSAAAERQSPSCSGASLVGTTSTESGTGGNPLKLPGKVYLAGPYKGASLSLAIITPASSGPFDLGNVVLRVALNLDPVTAQIDAVSDVIPDVFGGVKLDIRAIDLNLDRGQFTVNPTNCSAQASKGVIDGGGADPTNPAAFSSYAINAPFQPTGCEALGFRPKLTTRLSGPTKRSGFPRLTTTLTAREGDANVASVSLTLPHAFLVAQEHFSSVCTRSQLASHSCPESSVYGEAEARSPLLDNPLKGPVYLVPGGRQLPDLVVDLRGQVEIQLHGVVSSKGERINTVFESTPDVPLNEFVLKLAGGKKGLIVNSTNICKGKRHAVLDIKGQNGKELRSSSYKLNLASCKKHKKHKKHKHKKHEKRSAAV